MRKTCLDNTINNVIYMCNNTILECFGIEHLAEKYIEYTVAISCVNVIVKDKKEFPVEFLRNKLCTENTTDDYITHT